MSVDTDIDDRSAGSVTQIVYQWQCRLRLFPELDEKSTSD